jgi:hypothetical protein
LKAHPGEFHEFQQVSELFAHYGNTAGGSPKDAFVHDRVVSSQRMVATDPIGLAGHSDVDSLRHDVIW